MGAATQVRVVSAVLLGLYSIVIARLTLAAAGTESSLFATLNRLATRWSGGRLMWTQTEVLANVALFVPAGFLLAWPISRWVRRSGVLARARPAADLGQPVLSGRR